MTLQETYKMVISAEIRAQKLYEALAKSFGKPETKAVFTELVVLEKNHETKVREIYAELFPGEDLTVRVEEPIELQGLNLGDPKAVLDFAIQREDLAAMIYLSLADQTHSFEIKKLLNKFAAEEENHKIVLQTEIDRLQGTLEWFDPSELNGLMED